MQSCTQPQGQTSIPKKGLLSQLQQTQVVVSLSPLRCSSPNAGPRDPAAFGGIFTSQMLKDQEQQHLPSCQRQQVLQTL